MLGEYMQKGLKKQHLKTSAFKKKFSKWLLLYTHIIIIQKIKLKTVKNKRWCFCAVNINSEQQFVFFFLKQKKKHFVKYKERNIAVQQNVKHYINRKTNETVKRVRNKEEKKKQTPKRKTVFETTRTENKEFICH